MAAVHEKWGRLDILVNNAGIGGPAKPGIECTPDEWRRVFSVNLDGAFWCCRSAIPFMLRNQWGRVINVASIAGKEGNPNSASYSASKAGLIGLTKSLAKDHVTQGVLINCIASGVINTEILLALPQEKLDYMRDRIPMKRMGEPEEAAALIVWLASTECSFSTGAVYDLSGGRATY
jgi:2-dehydro-3-deoxy-L-rhamnonate dehydrogenase (NAD+)